MASISPDRSTLREAALRYAALGYHVFPCRPGGKEPAVERGFHAATTDAEQIELWWTDNSKYNIGLATADLIVLDVDGPDNPYLTPERAAELRTAWQTTPRGGRHYVFRQSEERKYRCSVGKIAPNIDVRAENGYFVVWPSTVDGKPYQWNEPLDCPPTRLPEPPQWLLAELAAVERPAHQPIHTNGTTITEGSRNSRLTAIAGYLRRGGLSEDEIFACLNVRNRRDCEPPLPDAEIIGIARSVSRYPPDQSTVQSLSFDSDKKFDAPFEHFTLGELCQKYPKLNYPVLNGLIREGETCNIISASKIGKSWLCYGLALSVATGRAWLDRFPTLEGRVLLIDNELHRPTIANRISTVANKMGIDIADVEDRITIWQLRGRLRDLRQLGSDFEKIMRGEYRLVILDAWYRAIPRDVSENDNAAIANLYNLLDSYAERLGVAFACIHHSSKGDQGGKRVTDVGAGAGAQSRAADCHLVLREHEEEHTVVLDAEVRSFPPVDPVVLRWDFPVWVHDSDADPEALRRNHGVRESQQDRKDLANREKILEKLNTIGRPATRNELRKETGLNESTMNRLLAQLVDCGAIEKVTRENKEYYRRKN